LLRSSLSLGAPRARGKVRDLYDLGDDLLLVATDRLSAFDVVMNEGIPGKGQVLTALSRFWLDLTRELVPNNLLSVDPNAWPELDDTDRAQIRGRAMRCLRAEPLPVECVVRGYLTGGGYQEYQRSGQVSGISLPKGLQHAARLDPPLFTPSSKAASGHDEPVAFARVADWIGTERARAVRDHSLALYQRARDHALERGIVIADTKFEFGVHGDSLLLIDEVLTPDSSRFWPADEVRPGGQPTSFDKQLVRDYLESLEWPKTPPPPPLPGAIVARTAATYRTICQRLTGMTPEQVLRP
jgi:phosphoribosylaminoimidazole-succinocarboxamide synthase